MVDFKREGLNLLMNFGRAILTEDPTDEEEIVQEKLDGTTSDPVTVYWESDKVNLEKNNQEYIDLFLQDGTKESQHKYDRKNLNYLPEGVTNFPLEGVPETPKVGTGISNSGRDAGVVAGIVVAVISVILVLGALIAVVVYRHYMHRNVRSMNFDNPVYRKTTEDQFALEKNGYAPGSKLYPSTVGEEAQEPLNTAGTNEFV